MGNNSTNINKTNNDLERQTVEHKNGSRHIALDIQILEWDRRKIVGVGFKLVNWTLTLPLMIVGSPTTFHVPTYKQ